MNIESPLLLELERHTQLSETQKHKVYFLTELMMLWDHNVVENETMVS